MPIRPMDEFLGSLQQSDVTDGNLYTMLPVPENHQTFMQKMDDEWQFGTTIGSLVSNGLQDRTKTNPNFSPAQELKDTPYAMFAGEALFVDTPEELEDWKKQKDREVGAAQRRSTSGWGGIGAMFAAQATDLPINLMPFLGVAKNIKTAGSLGKYTIKGAGMGAAALSVQEGVLQETQVGRSAEESLLNIGTGAVFGAVLGGAVGGAALSRNSLTANIVERLLSVNELPRIQVSEIPHSAGAAEVTLNLGDAHLAKMSVKVPFSDKTFDLSNLLQIPYLKAPVIEGLTADSRMLNSITSSMFEHSNLEVRNLIEKPEGILMQDAREMLGPYAEISAAKILSKDSKTGKAQIQVEYKDKSPENPNTELQTKTVDVDLYRPGEATEHAMETGVKYDRTKVYDYQENIKNTYLEYANTKPGAFEAARAWRNSRNEGKMSFREMLEEASRSSRRMDVHENPHVQRMAEIIRKNIDETNAQMQKSRVPLQEFKLVGRLSYYPIVHNKVKIMNDPAGFEKDITNYYMSTGTMSKAEAQRAAMDYRDKVTGMGDEDALLSDISRMSIDKGVRFTKERTSQIPDTVLEPWLVNDPMQTISQYMTQGSQLSRFYDMLHSHGVDSLQELKLKLHKEYENREMELNKADVNYNFEQQRLSRKYAVYQDRLQDFASIMLGQYSKRTAADNTLRTLRTYNYLRLMGMITINSITDLAIPIFKHGLLRTIMYGYAEGIDNIVKGRKGLETNMMRHMAVALEQELDGNLNSMVDPSFGSNYAVRQPKVGVGFLPSTFKLYNDFIYGSQVVGDAASKAFSKATLIVYWNKFHKRLAARTAVSRIIEDLKNYKNLSVHEKEYLNSIGIGHQHVDSILNQFNKYGGTDNGGHLSDIRLWSDRAAAERFSMSVLKEVDSTIVTPGKGDISRFVQGGELQRTLFQFKGFFSAMTTKVLISGLQRHDFAVAQGVVAALSLGALQYVLRTWMAGKEPDTSADNLLLEGINRSGLLGLLGDPIFGLLLAKKLGGGSRYYNQNLIEYMAGPSGSLLKRYHDIYQDVRDGKDSEKIKKKSEVLIPFQNLLGIRQLLDRANKE